MKTSTATLRQSQINMLRNLAAYGGNVPSIMTLVRAEYTGRGHRASYDRFHRLRRLGLVSASPLPKGGVYLTREGWAVLEDVGAM